MTSSIIFDTDNNNNNNNNRNKNVLLSKTGKILLGITGGLAVGLTVICAPFISPALRKYCLPYIPATNQQIRNILIALEKECLQKSGNSLIDLGSGDGRIVLETAKNNFNSHGIELNPWLVCYSKFQSFRFGLNKRTKFFYGNLWKFNLSTYDNIIIFGVEEMMLNLEKKLGVECKNGCNVIACRFPLPNLTPHKMVGNGIDTVWIYKFIRNS